MSEKQDDTVDKARAWDAANASWQKGYEAGVKAERERNPKETPTTIAFSLCRTPLIEEITPTNAEWDACETVADTYDLMKRRVRMAFRKMGEA